MIEIDLSTAVFLFTAFPLGVILLLWLVASFRKKYFKPPWNPMTEQVWSCSICAHVYIDTQNQEMSQCPLCASYNKREVNTAPRKHGKSR